MSINIQNRLHVPCRDFRILYVLGALVFTHVYKLIHYAENVLFQICARLVMFLMLHTYAFTLHPVCKI